ncbi:MAG: ABC transporter ATP-binding protein [Oscillospiraceae bacterium]|nr:ABC transporter ATP-binding protein [Oscillospiraceae bacterium]
MYDEHALAAKFDLKEWKRIFPYLKPYKKEIYTLIVCAVFASFVDAVYPLMTRYAINNFIEPKTLQGIVPFVLVFVATATLQAFYGSVIYSQKAIKIEMGIGRDMRYKLFRHVQELSVDYFNVTPVGFILARIMNDTNSMGGMFSWRLAAIVLQAAYLVFVMVNMLVLNFKLGIMVLAVMVLMATIVFLVQKKLIALNRTARRQNAKITAAYNEYITGAQTVKSLSAEQLICGEFSDINNGMRTKTMQVRNLERRVMPFISAIGSLTVAMVLSASVPMVNRLTMDVGTLAVFINYTFSILGPVEDLMNSLNNTISLQANVERVNRLMDTPATVQDAEDIVEKYGTIYDAKKENWEKVKGDIEFVDVSFKYPDSDRYVLQNFNLKINAGTCVAIVGHTGAGKSTLVNLVCRFFEPTGGTILIDGKDYRQRSLLWLESNLSYVLQSPHLFSGTILDNIRYANQDATMEQVVAAAKKAQAHGFIEKLPDGYNTDIGQGGDKLSTGQKQLISIARAILADGTIMVMDEATSSVDTKTEQLINGMTGDLLRGKTSFIIAHRLSTVKNADIIILVDNGQIVEMGSHRELLKKQGAYYDLYTSQWEEDEQDRFFKKLDGKNDA